MATTNNTAGTYEIGAVALFRGDEYTVTSAPVMIHGGEFQHATGNGKNIVVVTPRYDATRNAARTIARLETAARKLGELRPDLYDAFEAAMDAALDLRAGLPTGQEEELLSELEWTVADLESATPAVGCFTPRQQPAEILCS